MATTEIHGRGHSIRLPRVTLATAQAPVNVELRNVVPAFPGRPQRQRRPLLAIVAIAAIGLIGASVDYSRSRASATRAVLQAASLSATNRTRQACTDLQGQIQKSHDFASSASACSGGGGQTGSGSLAPPRTVRESHVGVTASTTHIAK